LVAGWPPVALLLSVELLAHRPGGREQAQSQWRPWPGWHRRLEGHEEPAARLGLLDLIAQAGVDRTFLPLPPP
jgi:hypothetical protein